MSSTATTKFKPNEGDWICTEAKCGNVNFARRNQCNKCGKGSILKPYEPFHKKTCLHCFQPERKEGIVYKKGGTEIGKNMAEKSKGLFSADDWQCKSCGNVNWARRMTCNMCNTPKYGKQEQRTGYGGGFMERDEVVEYKERAVDSDEEYDEFGRKKKKYRGTSTDTKNGEEVKQPVTEEEVEEEEEEGGDMSAYKLDSEEEDDDDADLGRYDLGSSDDEDSKPATNNKRSRSRSKSSRSSSSSSSRSSSSSSSSRSRSRSGDRKKRKYSRSRSRSRSRDRRSRSSSDSRSRNSSRSSRDKRSRRSRS